MKKLSTLVIVVATVLFGPLPWSIERASAETGVLPPFPPAEQNLVLDAPINSWDEAIPLGNGLTGGLLWGAGNSLHLGLDRGDLWDERPNAEKEWWKHRNWIAGGDWDGPYAGASPTKIPAGQLEITLAPGQTVKTFELNLATAEGIAKFSDGTGLRVFFSAVDPVALLRLSGPEPLAIEVLSPVAVCKRGNGGSAGPDSHSLGALGYPEARNGKDGRASWYVQDAADGLRYCVCCETRRAGGETLAALAITSTKDSADPLALARGRCRNALDAGYDKMLAPHSAWWNTFWSQSSISVPEPAIQKYYVFARYLYGAGSRRGAPPMPLQGVWSASNGSLPPWHGDYHSDLNTQMTYIAYQESGNFEEGLSYLDFLWNLAPTFRAFARDFYHTQGLAVPGVMSVAGQPLGGWGAYSLSPTMSAWNAHLFYLHWRYTADDVFLKTRAYPWCSEVGRCMEGLLKPDEHGVLKLLRSSSPEIGGNAFRPPNTNYDIMCLKMLFLALQEMADGCDRPPEAKHWATLAAKLGDFHTSPDGELMVDSTSLLRESHRHLSNLIGLYPFNLITREGDAKDNQSITSSLSHWDSLGTSGWCGYTWAWMSCLRSRVGDAETAIRDLDVFQKAFILRNGFHANGDQTRSGFSGFTYRPFTLEGNFLGEQAVQEMLLQSWSPTPGKLDTQVIRIFPSMPWRWHDASFSDLRAEGGYRVSARRENNATVWFRIVAGKDGVVRICDNFAAEPLTWSLPGVRKTGENFEFAMKAGQALEVSLPVPPAVPAPPANLAEPVVISEGSGISQTTLPMRIGAASDGSAAFVGEIAQPLVYSRPLTADEIAAMASPAAKPVTAECVVELDPGHRANDTIPNAAVPRLAAKIAGNVQIDPGTAAFPLDAFVLDGKSWLEIPNDPVLAGTKGLTLAAWVKPAGSPEYGQRILDKCPAGVDAGWRLDTHPSNSLRLFGSGGLSFPAKMPPGQWTHVAATIDGKTGSQTLYINGKSVVTNGN